MHSNFGKESLSNYRKIKNIGNKWLIWRLWIIWICLHGPGFEEQWDCSSQEGPQQNPKRMYCKHIAPWDISAMGTGS